MRRLVIYILIVALLVFLCAFTEARESLKCKCDPCCYELMKEQCDLVKERRETIRRRLSNRRELLTFDDIIDYITDGFAQMEIKAMSISQEVLSMGDKVQDWVMDVREDVANATARVRVMFVDKVKEVEDKAVSALEELVVIIVYVGAGIFGAGILFFSLRAWYNGACTGCCRRLGSCCSCMSRLCCSCCSCCRGKPPKKES